MRFTKYIALVVGVLLLAALPATALAATSPTVKLSSPTSGGQTAETLAAEINDGGAAATYHFAYGPTTALGVVGATHKLGASTKAQSVSTTISGLQPGTTYYYQLQATSSGGTTTSSLAHFTTTGPPPPDATTGGAEDLTDSAATVTGVVTPNGAATEYYFEYGLSTVYGLQTAPQIVPAGAAPVTVTANINGLQSGATFDYQLVVVHPSGAAVNGGNLTFEVYPNPRPAPKLSFKTTPSHESGGPFVFTTNGKLSYKSSTPASLACNGLVAVRFYYGRKVLTTQALQLSGNCSFSVSTRLRHKPSGAAGAQAVTVKVHYDGSGYLGTAVAKNQAVTVG
jgi:hypothetical protein